MALMVSLGYGGNGMLHNNMMLCPALYLCIALPGSFPPRP